MSAAPPSRWKRRIRRILAVLLLSPFLLLALANVLLATPWVKGQLGRKLSARLGVETVVGSVTCTPWGGLVVGDLRCLQPPPLRDSIKPPLLEVREIRAFPQWDRMLRGNLAISSIRIERPRLTLALELAASMVSAGASTTAPADVAVSPPTVASSGGTTPGASAAPQTTAPSFSGSAPSAPESGSSTIGTSWIEIVDGEGELWLSGSRLLSLRGGEGKIPFAGVPALAKLQLRELMLFDQVIGRELTLPLSWRAPELRCHAAEFELADLRVSLSAVLGAMPGIPFGIDITLPRQAAHGGRWLEDMKPEVGLLEARLRGVGLMRHPSTWQGLAAANAETVTIQLGEQAMAFDEGRANFALQGGVLQCPDIRLTGERASFLGNGQIGSDGQGTGVLRVVVPPDIATTWVQRLTIGDRAPVFAPLETPDRMFIDLRWISYSGGQGIELGDGGPIVSPGALLNLVSVR